MWLKRRKKPRRKLLPANDSAQRTGLWSAVTAGNWRKTADQPAVFILSKELKLLVTVLGGANRTTAKG
jgi:hypothetical protein